MNSKVYKWCAVPLCRNTSIVTPNKVFVYVPNKKVVRNEWLKLARRDPAEVVTNSPLYFCEEHFDLPNDMENYMQYHLMGSVSQVRMKPGCMPKNFACQADIRKQADTSEKLYIHKKRKKMATEECEMQSEESCRITAYFDIEKPASGSSETVQVKPELVCVKEEPVWEQDSVLSEERLREPVCENSATRKVCGREFNYEVKLECATVEASECRKRRRRSTRDNRQNKKDIGTAATDCKYGEERLKINDSLEKTKSISDLNSKNIPGHVEKGMFPTGVSTTTRAAQLPSSASHSQPLLPNTLNNMPTKKKRRKGELVEEFRKREGRNKKLRQLSEKHATPLHDFFNSMADVVSRFPSDKIAQIRSQVCNMVTEMELTILAQRETDVPSSNNHNKPTVNNTI